MGFIFRLSFSSTLHSFEHLVYTKYVLPNKSSGKYIEHQDSTHPAGAKM